MTLTIALLCCHQVQAQDSDCTNNTGCTGQNGAAIVHAWIERAQQGTDPDLPPVELAPDPARVMPWSPDTPYGRCFWNHLHVNGGTSKQQEVERDLAADYDEAYRFCNQLSDAMPTRGLRRRP
jgi:hypothetical protein